MSKRRIALTAVVSLAVAAAVFVYALPQLAAYGAVWRQVVRIPAPWLAAVVGITTLDLLTYPLPWLVVLRGLRWRDAFKMTQASTAFSLVVPGGAPLGMAVSFGMLRSFGFGRGAVASAVAATGIWNQVSTFLFPVVALVVLAAEGVGTATLRLLALVGACVAVGVVALLAAALWRADAAAWIGERAASLVTFFRRCVGKPPATWANAFVRQRAELLTLLRHRWLALTMTTLANQLTGYVMLDLSLRAVGVDRAQVSIGESFAAWSVGRILGSLPITPGGIGFVELGLTGTLIGFGSPHAAAVAAVLLYRAASFVPTIVLGALSALTWRRRAHPA